MQKACNHSLKATRLAAATEHDHHNTQNSHFVRKRVDLHLDAAFTSMWQIAQLPLRPVIYTEDH